MTLILGLTKEPLSEHVDLLIHPTFVTETGLRELENVH